MTCWSKTRFSSSGRSNNWRNISSTFSGRWQMASRPDWADRKCWRNTDWNPLHTFRVSRKRWSKKTWSTKKGIRLSSMTLCSSDGSYVMFIDAEGEFPIRQFCRHLSKGCSGFWRDELCWLYTGFIFSESNHFIHSGEFPHWIKNGLALFVFYRFCIFAKLTIVTLTVVSFSYCIKESPYPSCLWNFTIEKRNWPCWRRLVR